jgi:2-polyprenyl-3-methyl-5-hydroxy-6-metoxy-1,4-benzoquinol methylase
VVILLIAHSRENSEMSRALISTTVSTDLDPLLCGKCIACGGKGVKKYLKAPDRFHSQSKLYSLIRCPECSLAWIENPPSPAEMGGHYGPDYDAFIRKATENRPEKHWQEALATVRKFKEGGTLLDLGCGAGSFLRYVQGPSWTLYGIEMSAKAAVVARSRTGAQIFTGDILAASFLARTFDVITCFHVFEHLYSPTEVMARVWKWLKPGGVFCIHVPNIDAAEARLFRSYWYPLELPRHLYHFSPTSLRHIGKSLRFEEVVLSTIRKSFIEYSTRYICDDLLAKAGILRPALAVAPAPSLVWRVFRKGIRLTLLPMVAAIISVVGDGGMIEAVFKKPE